MRSNRLQLNQNKTELLWCASLRRQHQIDTESFEIGTNSINPSTFVRNLGVYLDNDMTMSTHIKRLVSICFGTLRQIRTIRRSLPIQVLNTLVSMFIMSRLDYCNIILVGQPQRNINRLQSVLNAAARLVTRSSKYEHITATMRDQLHWLKIQERITFKICLLVYKCVHGIAPSYLSDLIEHKSSQPTSMQLRSSESTRVVPRRSHHSTLGDRAFAVAGPSAWNILPEAVRAADNIATFKQLLKTHLFKLSYPNDPY
jgi:hypothetical protein